jgi:hypothetical protein
MILNKGDNFYGFRVQDVRDGNAGRTILFVKGNEGVYVTMSYDDYFTMIESPHERERILDNLAAAISTAFRDKSSGIWSKQ